MKTSTILTTLTTLLTTALAAPPLPRTTFQSFTIRLANGISMQAANAEVIVNNGPVTFGQLFSATFGPQVLATSLQNATPGAGSYVQCTIANPANLEFEAVLSAFNTFIDLDGNAEQDVPTDITNFTIECEL
ncbi:hypothetical protein TW65_91145 [Stemphylium lycopersici]|nr:hypothetical protein TW65_91145 [Stemphylium lycopersici]